MIRFIGCRVRRILKAPITPLIPVIPQHFSRVLSTPRTIATHEVLGGAVFVATPADTLGMFGVKRKLLGH